jgi:hypothetical protein
MTAGLVLPAPAGMRGVLLAPAGAVIGVALVLVFVLITPTP